MTRKIPKASQEVPYPDYELSPHQQAMVKACKAGRLDELERLFREHNISLNSKPLGFDKRYGEVTREGAPRTADLFVPAISEGHFPIVRFLHSIYPDYDFWTGRIMGALLEKPDLEMLKLVYSYSPDVLQLSLNRDMDSPLSVACEGGPANAPFINFMLDHDCAGGGRYSYAWQLGEALPIAIDYNQPPEIIRKMILITDHLFVPISAAIDKGNVEVLQLLLDADEKRNPSRSSLESQRTSLQSLQTSSGNEKIIAALQRYIENVEKQHERAEQAKQASERKRKSWWWSLLKTKNGSTSENVDNMKECDYSSSDEDIAKPVEKA